MGVLVFAFFISYISLLCFGGNWQEYCESKNISKWVFPLYLLIDGNTFSNFYGDNDVNRSAVFIACLIYLAGVIIFTGMIISVMTNMIGRRVEDHRKGRIHYLNSGHYIIMGYDDMIPSFISHIFEKDKDAYTLILSSADAEKIKERLNKSFTKKQLEKVIINYGHRTSQESYKDIHLESAEQVYIIGYRSKPEHDAINVECVDSIYHYLKDRNDKQRPKRITCVFKDLDTYAAFKTSDIFNKISGLGIEFVPYNFFDGWAKQVFVKREYRDFENPEHKHKYPAVYGEGIKPDDEKFVHLVFVGTTNFAVAFAMEAAHVLHFPNFCHNKDLKTKITFIDLNADKEKDEFIIRNRHFFEVQSYTYYNLSKKKEEELQGQRNEQLRFHGNDSNFLDVEFEFIKGDVFSKKIQDKISEWAKEHNEKQYLSIFLAMADQRQNFVLGMNMPDEVYDNEIPVFIHQDRSDNFVTNLRNADKKKEDEKLTYAIVKNGKLKKEKRNGRYANIYPFGMNETAYSADEHSLKRAKLINYLYDTANYNTYKFQGILALDSMSEEQIWSEADEAWRKLSVALKWSNLYSAYAIRSKLATLRAMRGLKLEDTSKDYNTLSEKEVEELAQVEHNRWNVEKLLMGYRKAQEYEDLYKHKEYSESLKANKKLFIHHDIRPFEQLDIISELDKEFSRYIPWIMRMTEPNTL
jgi:hypothetical protein